MEKQQNSGQRWLKSTRDIFVPLLKNMIAVGIDINQRKLSYFSLIFLILGIIVLIMLFFNSFFLLRNNSHLHSAITIIAWSFVTLCSLVCSYIFRIKKIKVHEILEKLSKCSKPRPKKILKAVYIKLIWIWANYIIGLAIIIWNIYFHRKSTMAQYFLSYLRLSDLSIKTICFFYIMNLQYFIYLPEAFILTLLSTCCSIIKDDFKALNLKCKDISLDSLNSVMAISSHYEDLVNVISLLNKTYSHIMFACTIRTLVSLIINANSFLVIDLQNIPQILHTITLLIGPFVIFSETCISASRMTDASRKVLSCICTRSRSCEDWKVREHAFQFYVQSKHEMPVLAACNIFAINRGLLLTICSVSLTYFIILYQIGIV